MCCGCAFLLSLLLLLLLVVCCRLLPLHCALSFFVSLISALACFFSALLLLLPHPCFPFSVLFLHHVIAFRCPFLSFLLRLLPFFRVGLPHPFVSHHCCFVPCARLAMKPVPKYKSCGVWRCVGDGICASSMVRGWGVREPAARPWQAVASERIGSDLP